MREIQEKVKYVLINKPSSRNCDKQLIIAFIHQYYSDLILFGNKINIDYAIPIITSFESITRARRKIQRDEYDSLKQDLLNGIIEKIDYTKTLYMPTELKVLHKRRMLCEDFKNYYRKI